MVKKKTNNKRLPPEKRMKRYRDYCVTDDLDDIIDVKWTQFAIIVPTKKDKEDVQAAMEYLHNSRDIDTDFVTVNQLVHEYDHGAGISRIVVDKKLYDKLKFTD